MSKYDEWKNRQKGFDDYALQLMESLPDGDLKDLTDALRDFTNQLFDFFLKGFSDFLGEKSKTIILIPSAEYPPEYVLQRILQQASFDLTVIQRTGEQRKSDVLRYHLEQFDQLALSALAIAFPDPQKKETWLIDPVKPFIYFQRDTTVRIIPYANTLLIGVPYSAVDQPIDLLSIPHEIGHHIYQTGRFSETEPINLFFDKYFADQPDWIQNWLEEIFADLYGFLVAGPIIASSLQEILLDNAPESLAVDDGDHPAGIIRPLIYEKLFNSDEYKVTVPGAQETAKALREKWLSERKKRGLANRFKSITDSNFIEGSQGSITLSSVMQNMNKEMNEKTNRAFVFPARLDQNDNLQPWTLFPDGESSASGEGQFDPEDPFAGFSIENVLKTQEDQINKVKKLYEEQGIKLSRKDQNAYWLTNQIRYWRDQNKKDALPALPPVIWKLLFTAFSWADKGPDDTRPVSGPENIRF